MHFKILNKNVDISSDQPAIISEKESISYEQLKKEINHLSGYLCSIGLRRGSHVSILCENNADFIILILSLWEIGAIPIPMNIRLLDEEIEKLIEHSNSEYLFIHKELDERLKGKDKRIIFPLEKCTDTPSISSNNFEIEDTALILYTSGTTGSPKGVMLSYNNLISSAVSADHIINHTLKDRWLASLPFYHIGGFSIPIRAFLYGSTVLIADSVKAESILEILNKLKPTLASFVSTTLKQLLEKNIRPNPELRLVLLGGGPIDDELASRAIKAGWQIIKVYGSTETSSLVTAININKEPLKVSSAGRVLPGNKILIIGENDTPLPPCRAGEVLISGGSLMKGYWKNPELTESKRKFGNFYCSGDIGFIDEDGLLYIESRRTDLIVSGGENINPLEVERTILKCPGIKEVCVFPQKDEHWGQSVTAAVVKAENCQISEEEIKSFLKERISNFKIPKKIFFIDELPKTSLGKLRRDLIRQRFST